MNSNWRLEQAAEITEYLKISENDRPAHFFIELRNFFDAEIQKYSVTKLHKD